MQKTQALTIYALIASLLAVGAVTAVLTSQKTISGSGSIKSVGLGVYWDQKCTNATSSLNFGQMEPGSSKNFTLYLKNEGNSVLTLSMTSQNWNPATASNYMTLTWNRQGQQVNPNSVITFVITLTISGSIQGISTYSFDIIISGTG